MGLWVGLGIEELELRVKGCGFRKWFRICAVGFGGLALRSRVCA